jgi:hypothetical protein
MEEDMKRMKILLGNRRMLLLATLAILVLSAVAIIASGASFTASKSNDLNVFTAGTLTLNDSVTGPVVSFTTPNRMCPGNTASGTVTIDTVGSDVDSAVRLTTALTGNAGLQGKLRLTIEEVGGGTLFGPASMSTLGTSFSLGTWAPDTSRQYRFTVAWPNGDDAGDTLLMGSECGFDLTWAAVADNTTGNPDL